jgi:hypothetical protein
MGSKHGKVVETVKCDSVDQIETNDTKLPKVKNTWSFCHVTHQGKGVSIHTSQNYSIYETLLKVYSDKQMPYLFYQPLVMVYDSTTMCKLPQSLKTICTSDIQTTNNVNIVVTENLKEHHIYDPLSTNKGDLALAIQRIFFNNALWTKHNLVIKNEKNILVQKLNEPRVVFVFIEDNDILVIQTSDHLVFQLVDNMRKLGQGELKPHLATGFKSQVEREVFQKDEFSNVSLPKFHQKSEQEAIFKILTDDGWLVHVFSIIS